MISVHKQSYHAISLHGLQVPLIPREHLHPTTSSQDKSNNLQSGWQWGHIVTSEHWIICHTPHWSNSGRKLEGISVQDTSVILSIQLILPMVETKIICSIDEIPNCGMWLLQSSRASGFPMIFSSWVQSTPGTRSKSKESTRTWTAFL